MKRFRLKRTKADPLRRDRLEHLLRVAEVHERERRPIPSHVLTELVAHADLWAGRRIPPAAIKARRLLRKTQ